MTEPRFGRRSASTNSKASWRSVCMSLTSAASAPGSRSRIALTGATSSSARVRSGAAPCRRRRLRSRCERQARWCAGLRSCARTRSSGTHRRELSQPFRQTLLGAGSPRPQRQRSMLSSGQITTSCGSAKWYNGSTVGRSASSGGIVLSSIEASAGRIRHGGWWISARWRPCSSAA
jgi:hypothetical protein